MARAAPRREDPRVQLFRQSSDTSLRDLARMTGCAGVVEAPSRHLYRRSCGSLDIFGAFPYADLRSATV